MAKSAVKEEIQGAPVTAALPKNKGLLLKILLVLVPLTGGIGGTWFAMKALTTPPAAATEAATSPENATEKAEEAEAEKAPEKASIFVPLDPFTVNLQPENGDQYLQVGLSVKVTEAVVADAIKQQIPEIRNRILLLLSSKKASEISTVAGKQQLSTDAMNEIKQSIGQEKLQRGITAVLFTAFIIQ